MKLCQTCGRTYTDETLRFCLEDGTPLGADAQGGGGVPDPEATLVREPRPANRSGQPPNEVLNRHTAETLAAPVSAQTAPPPFPLAQSATTTTTTIAQDSASVPNRRRTAIILVVAAVCAILLVSLGGLFTYIYLKRMNDEHARVADSQENRPANIATTQNSSSNNNSSRLANNGNSRPTPTAVSPTPVQPPVDAAGVAGQVSSALNGWAAATSARDIDAHMNYYADTLDTYYNAKNISASRVRADRERAFSTYSSMKVQLSNIKVTPDASGQRATATLDKSWNFEGDKVSTGSVQQLITLEKTQGRWRITGERDLQVYYVSH